MSSQMSSSSAGDLTTQGAQWLQDMKGMAMNMAQRDKKDDPDDVYSPYQGLQKSQVLQDCRCFNDREINPRRCMTILMKSTMESMKSEKIEVEAKTASVNPLAVFKEEREVLKKTKSKEGDACYGRHTHTHGMHASCKTLSTCFGFVCSLAVPEQ